MTTTQNQALKAFPNVLHDQTIPNTLSGIGPVRAAPRRGLPMTMVAAAVGVILAFLVVLVRSA